MENIVFLLNKKEIPNERWGMCGRITIDALTGARTMRYSEIPLSELMITQSILKNNNCDKSVKIKLESSKTVKNISKKFKKKFRIMN